MKHLLYAAGGLAITILCGCVGPQPPADQTGVSAHYVGDRARVVFDEVVVSLPLREVKAPYQNLHIAIAGFSIPLPSM
jgi:hypothetical protein